MTEEKESLDDWIDRLENVQNQLEELKHGHFLGASWVDAMKGTLTMLEYLSEEALE